MEEKNIVTQEQELGKYEDRFKILVKEGTVLKIVNDSTKVQVLGIIRDFNFLTKKYKELKDYFTKDLKAHVKKIEGNFIPYEKAIKEIVGKDSRSGLRGQLADWEMKCQEEARKEEERVRTEQQKKYDKDVAKADKKGEIAPPPPPPVNIQSKKEEGVSYRTEFDFQVFDENIIPREYLILDEKKVKKLVKDGLKNVPGLRIFARKIPIIKEESLDNL